MEEKIILERKLVFNDAVDKKKGQHAIEERNEEKIKNFASCSSEPSSIRDILGASKKKEEGQGSETGKNRPARSMRAAEADAWKEAFAAPDPSCACCKREKSRRGERLRKDGWGV